MHYTPSSLAPETEELLRERSSSAALAAAAPEVAEVELVISGMTAAPAQPGSEFLEDYRWEPVDERFSLLAEEPRLLELHPPECRRLVPAKLRRSGPRIPAQAYYVRLMMMPGFSAPFWPNLRRPFG